MARRLPLRWMTNGDARVAGGALATISGLLVTHYAMPWLTGPEAAGIGSAWAALLIIALGTVLGGKAGPDISAAQLQAARQQGREEAAAVVRHKIVPGGPPVYLDALADEVEGGAHG